jgi:CHAD domain-containing protein
MGILLVPADITQIEAVAEQGSSAALRRRAELLLLFDQGLPTKEVAEKVGLSPSRARYWRRRYISDGMQIFAVSTSQSTGDSAFEDADQPEDLMEGTALQYEVVELPQGEQSDLPQMEINETYQLEQIGAPHEQVEPAQEESARLTQEIANQPVSLDELRQRYPTNLRRAEHMRDLALELFDATKTTHQLPNDQRRLLEVAAMLQYLIESQEDETSNKAGYLFILSNPLTDLNDSENSILEDILRYQHEKVDLEPHADPAEGLPAVDEALPLAAILRIAQGLDSSQSQETTIRAIETTPQRLDILVAGPRAKKDARSAKKAARLWSSLFNHKVSLEVEFKVKFEDERLAALLNRTAPGVQVDDPLAEAGRKVLGHHFGQMVLHEDGTRLGEDIEELHDMRVATRRMRSAFDVFSDAYDPKEIKPYLKGLRATGRALGRVRDLDVFMEKAQGYLDTLPEEKRHGLDPLLLIWQNERKIEREKMLAHLNSESYLDFKQQFLEFLSTPGAGELKHDRTTPHLVQHVAPILIYSRLAAVRAYSSILDIASIEQLHGLRIEFKKLRYTLEYFREVLGEAVKDLIEEIKTMQDHLGDLNDADVACDILRGFLDDWESRQMYKPISERDNPQPIVAYLAAKHAERYFLTTTFQEVWQKFESPEMLANVASAIAVL